MSPLTGGCRAGANVFQEFAKEALQQASKAKSEQEKLALNELALAWVNAALASDRVFGSSWYFPWYGPPIDAGQDIGA